MKKPIYAFLLFSTACILNVARADFAGSTYTLTGPYSLCVTNASITINSIVTATYNVATLVVSNSAASPITVTWAAPGRAIGLEATNQLAVPGGEIAQINVNAAVPGMVIYSTQLEQTQPVVAGNPGNPVDPLLPDLLYYKLTEGAQAYQINTGYFESSPVYLADSSSHGGTTGTVSATSVPIQWVTNQVGAIASAIHYNGASTVLDTGATPLFNFTTNLFTINIWVRNLTYPCAICGNGEYLSFGWYVVVNTAGEIVVAGENPNSDKYVATTSTVAFAGQWCMITVVRTGTSTVSIYRNGVLQNTTGSFANPASCNNDMILGDNYYGNQYDGDLGTLRIYGRALSQTEVTTLYQEDTVP